MADLSKLIQLYRQAEDYFFKNISVMRREFWGEATSYMTKIPVAEMNNVFIKDNPEALDQILKQSERLFYFENNLPFIVNIPENFCTPQAKDYFKGKGYFCNYKTNSIFVDLSAIKRNHFDDEIIIQNMNDNLNDWASPPMEAFEVTPAVLMNMYIKLHENALGRGIHLYHYSLYIDGKPVSSATLSVCNGISRIDDVGTLPKFQNNGYGRRLLRYILIEAKKLGADYCFLESFETAFPFYEKLGFKTLFKNQVFVKEF